MAEEKGILATTPQRTTAILKVHFFHALMVLNGQSGEKKLSVTAKHTKLNQNTKQASIQQEWERERDSAISSFT